MSSRQHIEGWLAKREPLWRKAATKAWLGVGMTALTVLSLWLGDTPATKLLPPLTGAFLLTLLSLISRRIRDRDRSKKTPPEGGSSNSDESFDINLSPDAYSILCRMRDIHPAQYTNIQIREMIGQDPVWFLRELTGAGMIESTVLQWSGFGPYVPDNITYAVREKGVTLVDENRKRRTYRIL